MASQQYTTKDLYDAIPNWDEVQRILTSQPQLVNDKYGGVTSLWWIVDWSAPEDLVLRCLHKATRDGVDEVNESLTRPSILHLLAYEGYAEAMDRTCNISSKHVNLQDVKYNGSTPLHELLEGNHSFRVHQDAALSLINAGAVSDMKNKDGLTPADSYTRNECSKYDDETREAQKEKVLQFLHSAVIPGVILARGAEAVKVFNEELEKGRITVNHARLMVTGKEGVGKTCLVNTLLEKPFNEEEPSTDGIVLTTAFQTNDNDSTEWKEKADMDECERIKQIYDNALEANVAEKLKLKGSQTESSATAHVPVQNSSSVSASAAIPASEPIPESVAEPATDAMPEPTATAAAEIIEGEALPAETQKRIVNRMIGKTSGTIGNEDITYIWDFAGQQLYYITHRIFLTSEAVYLILFNLMESMHAKGKCRVSRMAKDVMTYDMTNIQIIKYWMRLIFTYAVPVESQKQQQVKKPQIAVVGTHSESLPGTDEDKKKQIKEQFEIIFQAIKGTPYECHVVRKMYAIDNKSSSSSEMLKTLKQDVGGFLKAMPKTIPLKWLEFQRLLQEFDRTALHMPYDEVCIVATKCGISVENLIHTLNYLHDLGIILYFENNRLLKHKVITNPRKLINIFKKIITVVEFDDKDKWPAMIKLWNKLDEEGILEEELVRHLWRDELLKDQTSFEVFLELMKQFGLLCEQIKKNREITHRSFFVPCRLKRSDDSMTIGPDTDRMVSIYMASEDFLPDSIFHPLVVSLIVMVQDMGYTAVPELFRNKANIGLGCDHNLSLGQVVIDNKPSLKLEISRTLELQEDGTETPTGEPSPRVCMQVLEFLKQEMKVLTSGMKHTRYKFRVLCWRPLQARHFHSLDECLMTDSIRCEGKSLKTSKLQRMFKNKKPVTDSSMQAASLDNTETAPPDGRLGYLEDMHLLLISKGMRLEWKQLGVRLGLSWNMVNQIWNDYRRLSDCTIAMLTEWRKGQNYETNQVEVMGRALKEQGLTELANKISGSPKSEDRPCVKADEEHASGRLHRMHKENDESLDDQDLLFVCDHLGSGWRRLAVRLGLKWAAINDIADNNRLVKDNIMEALVTWRDGQSTNQIAIMVNALRQQKLVPLAEDVCERHGYKDEFEVAANQMSPPQVSTQRLVQGYLEDADLLFISEKMGRGWKEVVRSLGIEDPELEEVETKFQRQMVETTLEILVRWRDRQGRNVNQLRKMKAAMNENERKFNAEKLEEYYQQKFKKTKEL